MEKCGSSEAKGEQNKKKILIVQRISKNIHRSFSPSFSFRSFQYTHTISFEDLIVSVRIWRLNVEVKREREGALNTGGNQPHSNTVCMSECLYEHYCDDNFFFSSVHPFCVHDVYFSFLLRQNKLTTWEWDRLKWMCVCVCSPYDWKTHSPTQSISPSIQFFFTNFTHAHIKWCYICRSAKHEYQNQ